jgi:DNA-binding NtrC family response regulator
LNERWLRRAAATATNATPEKSTMSNILIVDDDDSVRLTLRVVLERNGHQVAEAVDGNAGMKALRGGSYDLVITDIIMPDCEGIEFIKGALQSRPDRKIIAMSGGGRIRNTEFLDLAKKCGAKAVLAKPFEPEELLTAVGLAMQ